MFINEKTEGLKSRDTVPLTDTLQFVRKFEEPFSPTKY
jgi:hypothetical protein